MGPPPGQKLQIHPTNLTYSTRVMFYKGLGWVACVGFVECVGLL
jgi:hypothetical protein